MEHEHLEDIAATTHRRESPAERGDAKAAETDVRSRLGNRGMSAAIAPAQVQRQSRRSQGAGPLDPEIGAEISAAKGGGHTLDDSTRTDMEGHLGTDLASVRIHTDGHADSLSRSVQAEAFTTGTDVFFQSGKFQPGSTDGRRLIAHELTHVVQQTSGQTDGAGRVSHPDDSHEVEARSVGDAVASAAPVTTPAADAGGAPPIARQEMEEEELQASHDPTIAREEMEEEELQASHDPTIAREEMEEEELQA